MKILRNSAKCLNCGDVIESVHRHDFNCCSCGNICVDGGKDYLRRVGNSDQWTDTSVVEPDADDEYRDPGPRKEEADV